MTELFVTVEGIDGSGTTTVAEAIGDHFDNVLHTSEPSPHWTGQQVRRAIQEDSETPPLTNFFLFLADRANHVENTIQPALDEGKLVVSDRYIHSTEAYQAIELEDVVGRNRVNGFIRDATRGWAPWPDLTLWLDVEPGTSFERVGGGDVYEEDIEFQKQVASNYQILFNNGHSMVKVDANRPEEEVIETCINVVELEMNQRELEESVDGL